MYNSRVLSIFAEPHNVGILQSASGVGIYTNETTNEVYKLYLKLENNHIVDASFKVYSGVLGVATMSVLTDMLKGMSKESSLQLEPQHLLAELGKISKEQEYILSDALESIKLAFEDYERKLEKELAKSKKQK